MLWRAGEPALTPRPSLLDQPDGTGQSEGGVGRKSGEPAVPRRTQRLAAPMSPEGQGPAEADACLPVNPGLWIVT